jgi:hypothetical protein
MPAPRKTAAAKPPTSAEVEPEIESGQEVEPAEASADEQPDTGGEAAQDTAPAEPEPEDGEICLDCYPNGWPALSKDAYSAGCQHGSYSRRP